MEMQEIMPTAQESSTDGVDHAGYVVPRADTTELQGSSSSSNGGPQYDNPQPAQAPPDSSAVAADRAYETPVPQ